MGAARMGPIPSIRTNLLIWTTLALSVVGAVMVAVNARTSGQAAEEQLTQLASKISEELVGSLQESVWNMDDGEISHYFSTYPWESLGLASVIVTTEYGDLLFEKTYREEDLPIRRREPVVRNGKTVGFVHVLLSRGPLEQIQGTVARSGLLIIVFSTIAMFLVCTITASTVVIRPVRSTVSGLRRIAEGEYHHKLPSASSRELHTLNREINAMSAEIAARQTMLEGAIVTRENAERSLRELNEELEERIRTRTTQLRRLAKSLALAQDAEQKRIAEGLHDDVAQLLAACRMKLQVCASRASSDEHKVMIRDADELVGQTYERLRLLSFELASSTLYQWGLKDSLARLCAGMNERYGVSFELAEKGGMDDYDAANATVLFKSARELLFNVVKHSGVTRASVELARVADTLKLTVEDKGHGFDGGADLKTGQGLGLFSIKERLRDIGGELEIDSQPGVCTRVSMIVPWLEEDDDDRSNERETV